MINKNILRDLVVGGPICREIYPTLFGNQQNLVTPGFHHSEAFLTKKKQSDQKSIKLNSLDLVAHYQILIINKMV